MKNNKMIQWLLVALLGLWMSGCSGKVTVGEDVKYTVTATASAHGSVSPESSVVDAGKKAVFIVSANNGYRINTMNGCGGTLNGNIYTTEPINSDCSVSVSFVEISQGTTTYTINTSTGGKGVFTPSSVIVNAGVSKNLNIVANSGYRVENVTGCNGSLTGDTYTTGVINADCTVTATFQTIKHTVTASASAHGSVSPESVAVNTGEIATFTASADNGYRVNSIGGCGGTLTGNIYTTEPINSDCSVSVSFVEISQGTTTYTINTSTGGKGVFTPSAAIVNESENHTFQLLANSGYIVESVTGCGGSLNGDVYTTGAVSADCTVSASFITIVIPTLEPFSGNIEENATIGTQVGTVMVTSNGGADITAFTLSDTSNFSIDEEGVITSNSTLDYETTSSYSLTVTATNSAGESESVSVTINVGDVATDEPFIITVKTDNEGPSSDTEFTIPTRMSVEYNYNVDCDSDGIDEATEQSGNYTCMYNSAGTYTITISDNVGDKTGFPQIYFSPSSADRKKIIAINQWGQGKWTSMGNAFTNCENLSNENVVVADSPDLSNVTDMSSMFSGVSTFNMDIGDWNTSNVTIMEYMFSNATAFNQDIGNWNTSKVTTMENMFYKATAFNQDIGRWETGNVEWMYAMFDRATHFNQDIGEWDTGKVVDMGRIFSGAVKFNKDVGDWNTSKVTSMDRMFRGAVDFNQNIENWDTAKVRNMKSMFDGAVDFSNNDLSGWNVAGVIEHSNFFEGAGTGNTEPNWRVDPFIILIKMNNFGISDDNSFTIPTRQGETYNYNVDCDNDGVDEAVGVTGNYTCTYATPGNYQRRIAIRDNSGDLTGFPHIYFSNPGADKEKLLSIIRWGEGKWSSMEGAFSGCSKLNQNSGSMQDKPDLSNVTDMSYMFRGATLFNTDIRSWNTSNVRNMKGVFLNATSFNTKVENWNTQNVINMDEMFKGASSFSNHDLSVWSVDNVVTHTQFLEGSGTNNTLPNFP